MTGAISRMRRAAASGRAKVLHSRAVRRPGDLAAPPSLRDSTGPIGMTLRAACASRAAKELSAAEALIRAYGEAQQRTQILEALARLHRKP